MRGAKAEPATGEEMGRVHPETYLVRLQVDVGCRWRRTWPAHPVRPGRVSRLRHCRRALRAAALRPMSCPAPRRNAYALSRPPGHHCTAGLAERLLPSEQHRHRDPRRCRPKGLARRIAVVDWDVHHGNGTEAVFWEDPDVLAISSAPGPQLSDGHRRRRRAGRQARGEGTNLNHPAAAGHRGTTSRIFRRSTGSVVPALDRFRPDVIVVACGFDAAAVDPLGPDAGSPPTPSAR